MKYRLSEFFATGFYSGYSRRAPGTAGTVVAAVLGWVLFSQISFLQSLQGQLGLVGVITCIGLLSIRVLRLSGSERFGIEDPQMVVIDEFAGYFVTLLGHSTSLTNLILAFVFFRIFDILKPPPVSTAETLPGEYGVMADDLLAGVYANLVLTFCLYLAS